MSARAFEAMMRKVSRLQLPPGQRLVLLALAYHQTPHSPALPVADLAACCGLSPASVARHLAALEKAGLAARTASLLPEAKS